MKNDRITKGLHPDWCELGDDCMTPGRDPRHVGKQSTMWPLADDVRIDVEMLRSDDEIEHFTIEGERRIVLRLTNEAHCNVDGSPMVADTYLSERDALALAHVLETYAKRLQRRDNNFDAATIRNDVEPIGSSA